MVPDFSAIAPYGIAVVAVVGLVSLGFARNNYIVAGAMAAVLLIVVVDLIVKPMLGQKADANPNSPPPAPATSAVSWVDTNVLGDWGGRDRITPLPATSGSPVPLYETKDGAKLCDDSQRGVVAVCWDKACTYKLPIVHFGTPMDGASPGRIYVCGRVVSR